MYIEGSNMYPYYNPGFSNKGRDIHTVTLIYKLYMGP